MLSHSINIKLKQSVLHEDYQEKNILQYNLAVKHIRTLIWIYFYLVIFEGALRKWVFPSLSTPLLVIRDPIALWTILYAWNKGLIQLSGYMVGMIACGFFSFMTAITIGHGSIPVAIFGLRIYICHFPLMFVMGKVCTKKDALNFGKAISVISIFMAMLIAVQFFSPQTAWVNKGVGEDEGGAGFTGALGYFRPPGTFSFTNGNTVFFSLVGAYVLYYWLNPKEINRWLHIFATGALLAAIPLSISRSLFFSIIISVFFAVISTTGNIKVFKNIVTAFIVISIALALLSQTEFFQTATLAFTARLEGATESEGGYKGVLIDRYMGGLASAIFYSYLYPFFGIGLGIASNVGAMLAPAAAAKLGRVEGDWGRTIAEQGLLIGLLVILIRLIFSIDFFVRAYQRISRGNLLPWMLTSFGITIVPQGLWAQPTSLGFSTLAGGLILASFNTDENLL